MRATAVMAGTAPRVSVVLSTCNRRDLLARALRCLLHQPGAPAHEILVIDNRSVDGTRDMVEALVREVTDGRLVYAYEPRQGLSHARNAGIALARAPIVAFTDDDVLADPDWIAAIDSAFARHPDAQYVGGRVLPRRQALPAWLTPAHWSPLALQDHGPVAFAVGAERPLCLVGANMAFRAGAFITSGLFSPTVQLMPGAVGSTEDDEMMRRVWQRGGHGVYDPSIVVRTGIQPERLTRRYHRRWHYAHGRSYARMRVPDMERSRGRLFDVPLHLYRQACRDAIDRARHILRRDAASGFLAETRLCFFAGFVRERAGRGTADGPAPMPALARPSADPPLVSIVIPCFNQAAYLPASIGSALAQTHRPLEIVVVDDGSADDTAGVASRYDDVMCIRQTNRGLAHARNAGLAACRGAFVVCLDADDRLDPRAVERGLRALAARPDAGLAFGRPRVIDASGALMFTAPPVALETVAGDGYAALLGSNVIWNPAVALIRRDVLDAVGGFDPGVHASADYDLYLRIARRFPLAAHGDVVADYRHHGTAMSRNAAVMLRTTLAVHRRQQRYARHDPARLRAYREGRRYWQRFFGDQLIDEIRAHLARGSYWPAGRGLCTMAWHAPRRLVWHVGRWLRNSSGLTRVTAQTRQP